MPLRTGVRVQYTPIRRAEKILDPKLITEVRKDLNDRANDVIKDAREGYHQTQPKYYSRTYNMWRAWKKNWEGITTIKITNDVEGTNWSRESGVRYAQFVYGTVTDPGRQGQYQQDWPLIYDIFNSHFLGAARDRSHSYALYLQRVINRHLT